MNQIINEVTVLFFCCCNYLMLNIAYDQEVRKGIGMLNIVGLSMNMVYNISTAAYSAGTELVGICRDKKSQYFDDKERQLIEGYKKVLVRKFPD